MQQANVSDSSLRGPFTEEKSLIRVRQLDGPKQPDIFYLTMYQTAGLTSQCMIFWPATDHLMLGMRFDIAARLCHLHLMLRHSRPLHCKQLSLGTFLIPCHHADCYSLIISERTKTYRIQVYNTIRTLFSPQNHHQTCNLTNETQMSKHYLVLGSTGAITPSSLTQHLQS